MFEGEADGALANERLKDHLALPVWTGRRNVLAGNERGLIRVCLLHKRHLVHLPN